MHSSSSPIRIAAAWLFGLTLAIAAAIVAVFVVNTQVYSPQHQIEAYLEALEQGNGGEALGLLNATLPAGSPAMLDGEGLELAMAGLQDVRIGEPEELTSDRVSIPVEYTVGGTSLSTEFLLERTATMWLFFDEWTFVPAALPTISVAAVNVNEATLNGERVGLPEGEQSFAVFYPGEYSAAYQSKYFAAEPTEITVSTRQDSASSRLNLATQPTDELIADVDASLREYLDICAEQDVFFPETTGPCPFYHAENTFVPAAADIAWDITKYPDVQIDAFEGHWVLEPLNGIAVMETMQIDLFTGAVSPLRMEHEFQFTARLDVTDQTISVTPVVEI